MSSATVRVTPSITGALLLVLRDLLPDLKALPTAVEELLAIAGTGKSQAYAVLPRLQQLLPTLLRSAGRPASQPSDRVIRETVLQAVLEYSFAHRDAVRDAGERRVYSDDFRAFIIDLTGAGQPAEGMSLNELAALCRIPLGTLKHWHRSPQSSAPRPKPEAPPPDDLPPATSTLVTIEMRHLQTIVEEWQKWKGPFTDFCTMLRAEHRLTYGDTFIGNTLQALRLRDRKRRHPIEAPWSSDTFRKLFPGAQWLGDGTSIAVRWAHLLFVFNVEALLDVASNSTVGFHVTDSEDEEALRRAYEMGVETTGASPLFLSLDNRPSNHSPNSLAALVDTVVVASTPGRGQAKAPLEGSFGLFQQSMPPIVVDGTSAREMARCVLTMVMTAWFRGRNGRPRKRLGKLSPAEAYFKNAPTQEELDAAFAWLRELQRRREEARQTREARRDPVRLGLLTRGLAELGILDPDRRLTISLAYYSRDAIVRGLATFRAKLEQGTLPPAADHGRYLGGIIRQIHTQIELELTAIYLLEQRVHLRDLTLAPLTRAAEQIRAHSPADSLPLAYVDRALSATWEVDFRYWSHLAADALSSLPEPLRTAQYHSLARRVAAAFKTDRIRRDDLIDRLAQGTARTA
jgi:hypothetical protein